NGGPGADRLGMTLHPIPAQRPVHIDGEVSDLAGGIVRPLERVAPRDDPAADAGGDGDVDRVVGIASAAVAPLGHHRHVRVALEEGWHAQLLLDAIRERDVDPAGQVWWQHDDALPRVEGTG